MSLFNNIVMETIPLLLIFSIISVSGEIIQVEEPGTHLTLPGNEQGFKPGGPLVTPQSGAVRMCAVNITVINGSGNGSEDQASLFTLDKIDTRYCSHILLHNAGAIVNDTLVTVGKDQSWIKQAEMLKNKSEGKLHIILSIGGWDYGLKEFQGVASYAKKRGKFLASVKEFLKKYDFIDGINIAWIWPGSGYKRGGTQRDKNDLSVLMDDLRNATGPETLLTLLLSGETSILFKGYDFPRLSKTTDLFLLLSQDYAGNFDGSKVTGHQSSWLITNQTINQLIHTHGVEPTKIVISIPFYGRSFILKDKPQGGGNMGLGDPIVPNGHHISRFPPHSKVSVPYREICYLIRTEHYSVFYDPQVLSMFAVKGKVWISFDGVESLKGKREMVETLGLGGIMGWTVDMDDYEGKYCGEDMKWAGLLTGFGEYLENDKLGDEDDLSNNHVGQDNEPRHSNSSGTRSSGNGNEGHDNNNGQHHIQVIDDPKDASSGSWGKFGSFMNIVMLFIIVTIVH